MRTNRISNFLAISPMTYLPIPACILLAAGSLSAATTTALFEQTGAVINGWYSDASLPNPQALGDRFQTSASWSVEAVTWSGVYSNNTVAQDSFTVNIWDTGVGALPTVVLPMDGGAVTRQAIGQVSSWGWDIYEYTMPLNEPLLLDPATTYVFEVQNNTSGSSENWAWLTASGPRFLYHREGTWYEGDSGNLIFSLQGQVVPEPASITLFALAGAAGLVRRRRH